MSLRLRVAGCFLAAWQLASGVMLLGLSGGGAGSLVLIAVLVVLIGLWMLRYPSTIGGAMVMGGAVIGLPLVITGPVWGPVWVWAATIAIGLLALVGLRGFWIGVRQPPEYSKRAIGIE